jgi:hypothetical protein
LSKGSITWQIVDEAVINEDYTTAQDFGVEKSLKHQLFYQLSRITRDKGCIPHDDKLDSLSMACQYWVDQLARDSEMAMKDRHDELRQKDYEAFMDQSFGNWKNNTPSWL